MKAKLQYKGREILIEDIIKAEGIKKFTGLMFKNEDANAILFEYNGAIHSFFCKPFLAIWLNNGKIVEHKLVQPNAFSVKPDNEFDKLIEIPFNSKYSAVINFFLDASKI